MNIYALNSSNQGLFAVLFIIIGVLVLLGVLGFVLYKFVFSRSIAKKQLREIQRKYNYLSGMLIGNDGQYIHRLEIVSRTNILYIETYEHFSKRFKDIHDIDDNFALNKIKQVESLINNGHYKGINEFIDEARKAVAIFEEQVNKLHKDLYEVIKPEEDARKTIHALKEQYREVKRQFYVSQNDLEISAPSFLKTFEKLDQCFTDFESDIDSAKYEEANALLPTIVKVINALGTVLEKLPNLTALIISVIPEKLASLDAYYQELENSEFPLWHLGYKAKKDNWNLLLDESKNKIISLQTSGVLESANKIQDEIDEFVTLLDSEKEAKQSFDVDNEVLYRDVNTLVNNFVKICSLLPKIEETYIIEENEKNNFNLLKSHIDRLDNSKRSLDVFIHSNTKQPYSVLMKKNNDLRNDFEVASKGVESFKNYINSLKTSAEEAYRLIYDYYYRLKSTEEILRNINIIEFSEKYNETIDDIYLKLDEIYSLIRIKPINVTSINERVEGLKNIANSVFDEVDTKARECHLAESMIVYCNRDRKHQTDVDHQLKLLEDRFFNGEFEDVYHQANNIFKRTHIEDKNSHGQ